MEKDVLVLAKRTVTGKKVQALRAEGQVPSVVYGDKDFEPILTSSAYGPTRKAVAAHGYHSPIELEIDGKSQLALIKAVDVDAVTRQILNIEFRAVTASETVEATTPIVVVNFGDSPAAKAKLNILAVMDEIAVRAKPSDLPEQIEVDGSQLAEAGDRLTVADLNLPKGVELADKELDPATPVANVYDAAAAAKAQEEKDLAAAEAAAEGAADEATEGGAEAAEAPATEGDAGEAAEN